jgi:hypothetical protein
MVHFPGLSSPPYGFRWRYSGISLSGLPHSDILGSKPVCGSPKLFAAYHVLHRLLAPRHSPYALSSLTIRNSKLTMTVASLQFPAPSNLQLETGNWKLATPSDSSFAHCVCEPPALAGAVASVLHPCGRRRTLWSEKTTVCRIFSCKRARLRSCRRVSAGGGRSRDSFSPN